MDEPIEEALKRLKAEVYDLQITLNGIQKEMNRRVAEIEELTRKRDRLPGKEAKP